VFPEASALNQFFAEFSIEMPLDSKAVFGMAAFLELKQNF
jgi:hypothetical protein